MAEYRKKEDLERNLCPKCKSDDIDIVNEKEIYCYKCGKIHKLKRSPKGKSEKPKIKKQN